MKIGVFDSGIGGLSVANAIAKAMPEHEILFRNDRQHVPYGTREPNELLGFITPILQVLIKEECQVIVVACNTVSTTLIDRLREQFTVPLIAVEPMIKPASELTRTGIITVCATPTTLKSKRYQSLKTEFGKNIQILEPDCADWSEMIEDSSINEAVIQATINDVLDKKADVIVLACTHYHWIQNEIEESARGRATVIQPESAIIAQLTRVLSRL